jgi:histidine triad (HIT) family protein
VSDCLFCKICAGEIPAKIAYQDEHLIAFHDIEPQAPTHILIIPRIHIATINDIKPDQAELIGKMVLTAQHLTNELNLADAGYRLVMNCNKDGGQAIYHIHLHLLGGRAMKWPPG